MMFGLFKSLLLAVVNITDCTVRTVWTYLSVPFRFIAAALGLIDPYELQGQKFRSHFASPPSIAPGLFPVDAARRRASAFFRPPQPSPATCLPDGSNSQPSVPARPLNASMASRFYGSSPHSSSLNSERRAISTWSHTHSCVPLYLHRPTSAEHLAQIVNLAKLQGTKIKIFGVGHSPNSMAMCDHHLVSLSSFNSVIDIDSKRCTVTAQAGILMEDLNVFLARRGMALSVLGSISDLTLGGAIATAYHGSGLKFGSLSSLVVELVVMDGRGRMHRCSRLHNADLFDAARVSLGCMMVLEATLQCEPAFDLDQRLYSVPFARFVEQASTLLSSGDHNRAHWLPYNDRVIVHDIQRRPKQDVHGLARVKAVARGASGRVWTWILDQYAWFVMHVLLQSAYFLACFFPSVRQRPLFSWSLLPLLSSIFHLLPAFVSRRLCPLRAFFLRFRPVPVINRLLAVLLAPSSSSPSSSAPPSFSSSILNRLSLFSALGLEQRKGPSFRVFNFDCGPMQHVCEWAIPLSSLSRALSAINEIIQRDDVQAHFPVEIRTAKADDIWLSPSYGRSTAYIGVQMFRPFGTDVDWNTYFQLVEAAMLKLGGRPHWAKEFGVKGSELGSLYPKWSDFQRIRAQMDPFHLFDNQWAQSVLDDADSG